MSCPNYSKIEVDRFESGDGKVLVEWRGFDYRGVGGGEAIAPETQTTDVETLCATIRQSTTLKQVEFHCKRRELGANGDALSSMLDAKQQYLCPIQSFIFSDGINGKEIKTVLPFMISRSTTLWRLDLSYNELSKLAVRCIIDALNKGLRISHLTLHGKALDDEAVSGIVSSNSSRYLIGLTLGCQITVQSVYAFAKFFQREGTSIESFDIRHSLDAQCQLTLLMAVPTKSTLTRLSFGYAGGDQFAQALENLICNRSSFHSLCQSNHQLGYVGGSYWEYPHLEEALAVNQEQGYSTDKKIRCKIREIYCRGNFDVTPFIDLDVVLMPFLLGMVTAKEAEQDYAWKRQQVSALNSVFRLIRNVHLPALFSFPSKNGVRMQHMMTKYSQLKAEKEHILSKYSQLEAENEVLKERIKQLEENAAPTGNEDSHGERLQLKNENEMLKDRIKQEVSALRDRIQQLEEPLQVTEQVNDALPNKRMKPSE